MGKQTLDFLYQKKKNTFKETYRVIKVANMYESNLDKEVVLMVNAIENRNRFSTRFITSILSYVMPMSPYEWITSKNPILVFASLRDTIEIGENIQIRHILEPLRRLIWIYKHYGSVQSFCRSRSHRHPQEAIYRVLYGEDKTGNYTHVGLARAIMWLTRNGKDDVSLGIWDLLKPNQLRVPMSHRVIPSLRGLGLASKKKKYSEKNVYDILLKMNKKDPLKYMPILEVGTCLKQLEKLGYVRVL